MKAEITKIVPVLGERNTFDVEFFYDRGNENRAGAIRVISVENIELAIEDYLKDEIRIANMIGKQIEVNKV